MISVITYNLTARRLEPPTRPSAGEAEVEEQIVPFYAATLLSGVAEEPIDRTWIEIPPNLDVDWASSQIMVVQVTPPQSFINALTSTAACFITVNLLPKGYLEPAEISLLNSMVYNGVAPGNQFIGRSEIYRIVPVGPVAQRIRSGIVIGEPSYDPPAIAGKLVEEGPGYELYYGLD
jgi:hypothetical protein